MAQINMDGRQSFLLNDIKQVIRQGGNVSHILNVKVSRQPNSETGTAIRKAIFRRIAGNAINKVINGVHVSITWRTSAQTSSAYYHADVAMFTDVVVKRHTQLLLTDLLGDLNDQFEGIFLNGATGLAFLVSRPLVRQVVLVEGENELGDGQEEVDLDEIDEAEEQL